MVCLVAQVALTCGMSDGTSTSQPPSNHSFAALLTPCLLSFMQFVRLTLLESRKVAEVLSHLPQGA